MLYPEGTKVIVIPETVEEMSDGGIWFPDTARDGMKLAVTRGEIYAIGPKAEVRFTMEGDLTGTTEREGKPGDRVMFVKYAGASLKLGKDRVEYRILQDEDIVCLADTDETEMPDTRKSMVK